MFEAAAALRDEFADLERQLAQPETHADLALARRIGRRYAELTPIVKALAEHDQLTEDLTAARELAQEDAGFAAEAEQVEAQLAVVTERLSRLLAPRDPHDSADALMEVKSGEGGEESALFAADRMYSRYAESRGWPVDVLDSQETDLGGFKSITFSVKGRDGQSEFPYGALKFEGGVHRVQRVPVTETQGRVHTSAAGVLVMPDDEESESEVEINPDDLRIDVYRSSGKGGQGVNTTDSAVRITHLPSGIVVTCQNERSQLQNKASAMRILRARLAAEADAQADADAADARRSQVRTVDRSERIRTYNFGENRIADHRIGYKAYNLDQVLGGDLTAVVEALQAADLAERLEHLR